LEVGGRPAATSNMSSSGGVARGSQLRRPWMSVQARIVVAVVRHVERALGNEGN
jgi:hypothetical protein